MIIIKILLACVYKNTFVGMVLLQRFHKLHSEFCSFLMFLLSGQKPFTVIHSW